MQKNHTTKELYIPQFYNNYIRDFFLMTFVQFIDSSQTKSLIYSMYETIDRIYNDGLSSIDLQQNNIHHIIYRDFSNI